VNAALNLGPEDDRVSFLSRNIDRLDMAFDTDDGDDTVNIFSSRSGVGILKSIDAGATWNVVGRMGAGNDTVRVNSVTGRITGVVVDPSDPSSSTLDMVVDLGIGNDVADIYTQGYSENSLNLTAGPGDDDVSTDSFYGTGVYKTTDSGKTWSVNLGDGNDRLVAASQGFSEDNTIVKAGGGNDTVVVNARIKPLFAFRVEDLDQTQLNLTADLGGGDDRLDVESLGYWSINTTVKTGPEEDGFDKVTAIHHALIPTHYGRGQYQLYLDDGRDVFEGLAVGYAAQEPVADGVVVEWVFGVELQRALKGNQRGAFAGRS
jgi:hypothetical protein